MLTIRQVFDLLRQAHKGHTYRACRFGGVGTYLALDRQDRPSLFIRTQDKYVPWSQRTDSVALVLGEEWRIHLASGEMITDHFHALRCKATDESTINSFLLIVGMVAQEYGERPPSQAELTKLFQSLIQLFRQPRERDVATGRQGLWAELSLMQQLGDQSHWMRWWHSDPYRRWDFTCGMRHIEVKSSTGPAHAHTFAHRQLHVPSQHSVAIFSMLLRPDVQGICLQQLIAATRSSIRDDLQLAVKLEKAVRAVDMTDPSELGPSFAEVEADRATAWYWAAVAPSFAQGEPRGVSNTHYRVDLTTIPTITRMELDSWLASWE